jgi:hypothetical protein
MNKFGNENASEPNDMPRVRWPNDIMPDENSLSELSKDAQDREVKAVSSNPRS